MGGILTNRGGDHPYGARNLKLFIYMGYMGPREGRGRVPKDKKGQILTRAPGG